MMHLIQKDLMCSKKIFVYNPHIPSLEKSLIFFFLMKCAMRFFKAKCSPKVAYVCYSMFVWPSIDKIGFLEKLTSICILIIIQFW